MELDGIGARCALPTCRKLDYLPVRCSHCSQTFCDEHQVTSSHDCKAQRSSLPSSRCPSCGRDISGGAEGLSKHVERCSARIRRDPLCAKKGCSVRDPAAVVCPRCSKAYCIAHRLQEDHDCLPTLNNPLSGGRRPVGKTSATQQTGKAGSSVGAGKTTARPKLVRTDHVNTINTPDGGARVQDEDRIVLSVYFPAGSNIAPRYMVLSRRHSAGKILDEVMSRVSELRKPEGGGRYYLYAVKEGFAGVNLLPHIVPLRELPPDVLKAGDSLVIETTNAGLPMVWSTVLKKQVSPGLFSAAKRKQWFRFRLKKSG